MMWVIGIGLTIFVVVAIWFVINSLKIIALRKSNEILSDIALKGDNLIIKPESGSFRGSTSDFGRVKCDGIIALTDKRLIFKKLIGGDIEILRKDIISVSNSRTYLGEIRLGYTHLVLTLKNNTTIGFFVKDTEKWKSALS